MIQRLPNNSAAFVTQTQTGNQESAPANVQTLEKAQSTNLVQQAKASERADISQKKALIGKASDRFKEAIKVNPNFSHVFVPFL